MAFFAVYSQPTACESSAAPFSVSSGGVDSTSDAGIVGGIPGNINNYPFFAIADLDGGPSCGAVLIHPDILATAAHCFREWRSSSSSQACIGTRSLDCSDTMEIIPFEQDYIHPDYVRNTVRNDIMLIKLVTPSSLAAAPWNTNATIPLAKSEATLIGLGRSLDEPKVYPSVVQELNVTIGDPAFCRTLSNLFDPDTVICADGIAAHSGACVGDS